MHVLSPMVPSFASSSPATVPGPNPLVVLLVDSDEDFRSGLAENLRDDGHEVQECTGPDEVPPLTALARVNAVVIGQHNLQNGTLAFADAFEQGEKDVQGFFGLEDIRIFAEGVAPPAHRLDAESRALEILPGFL